MKITNKDIQKLIEIRKEDSFFNHILTVFGGDYTVYGEIGKDEIKIWYRDTWLTVFYPVFKFELNTDKELSSR